MREPTFALGHSVYRMWLNVKLKNQHALFDNWWIAQYRVP